MEKELLLAFIFVVLIFNIAGAHSSLENNPLSGPPKQEEPDFDNLDPGAPYCWRCVDDKLEIFLSKLITNEGCYDEDFNFLSYSKDPSLKNLTKTAEINGIISESRSLEQLSQTLFNKGIIGCAMPSLQELLNKDAKIIDSDNNGIPSSGDTVEGYVEKTIELDLGGEVAILYPGTELNYDNGVFTVFPGRRGGEDYLTFNNQKILPTQEGYDIHLSDNIPLSSKKNVGIKSPVTASTGGTDLTANIATSIRNVNLIALMNNLLKKIVGFFA
ncbi:MAG: hypothetical protein KKE23_03130 [Nanoarchaeota archaeon]|nr:hypothetical protein [Nanoarchaeota archaeon]